MSAFEPVIGLEIHVQLKTETKMFCSCALSFGQEPNTLTCPVCLGHPGTLPVLNRQAVMYGLMIAEALECEVAPRSIFHRKNYFYPDLPKGYQISQYDIPLAVDGKLGDVRIHRVHLEEDAAKLTHVGESGRIHGAGDSLVDFNRGGTPLVEIVSEPDIGSAEQAKEWLQLLRTTLRQIGVSDVNMEEGSLRCDANVSIRPQGSTELGVKTELKNMNSFRFLERGVVAEIERQEALVAVGEPVVQETLHFDPDTGSLSSLRSKEEAHDYRYFPEPDLVPVVVTNKMLEQAKEALPELPARRFERYVQELGISEEVASTMTTSVEAYTFGNFFEAAMQSDSYKEHQPKPQVLANLTVGDFVANLREAKIDDPFESKVAPEAMAQLAHLVDSGQLTSTASKRVVATLVKDGGDTVEIVEREGLGAISDNDELEAIVRQAVEANPKAVEQFNQGKEKAIGPIMGMVMKETKGRADGQVVNQLIKEIISGSYGRE